MKRIGIVTLHFSINYGAVLQCMALQKYLTEKGNEVDVIDYVPDYLEDYWKPWISPIAECKKRLIYCGKNPIKTLIIMLKTFFDTLHKNKDYFYKKKKYGKFEAFSDRYITKTSEHYSDIKKLKTKSDEYDVIFSGSDQVWNPSFTRGQIDDVYLLAFGNNKYTKATYAASAGISENGFIKQLAEKIHGIEYISVREKSLAEALNECDESLNVSRVIDPTLLITGQAWRGYESSVDVPKEGYIFVYCLKQHDEFANVLKLLKKRLGYKVVDISPMQVNNPHSNTINASACGPGEFLSYIDQASFVVTNSFHATVFSILFEKQFLTIPDNDTGARMIDLLQDFELTDRIYSVDTNIEEYIKPVEYSGTKVLCEMLKAEADDFLKKVGV